MRVDAIVGVREAVAYEKNLARWICDDSWALRRSGRVLRRTSLEEEHHGQNDAGAAGLLWIHRYGFHR